jgi:TusE/DsrC/DsvC family sulfur relay protein
MAQTMQETINPGASHRDADFPYAGTQWSREGAEEAARAESLELSADHWVVIGALQRLFTENGKPNVRDLHDALGEHFHAKGGLKYLYSIFPGGPVAQGCRFAGLEAPAGAVDKSFGSVQ